MQLPVPEKIVFLFIRGKKWRGLIRTEGLRCHSGEAAFLISGEDSVGQGAGNGRIGFQAVGEDSRPGVSQR